MPWTDPIAALTGDALLHAVTDAIVALHERYYARAPATAKSQLLSDPISRSRGVLLNGDLRPDASAVAWDGV